MNDDDGDQQTSFRYYLKVPITAALISTVSLLFLMANYPPGGGPIVITLFLFIVFWLQVSLVGLILQFILKITSSRNFQPVKLFYSSVVIGTGGILLVGLQTLRQLQVVDFVLVGLFSAILLFYLLRRF